MIPPRRVVLQGLPLLLCLIACGSPTEAPAPCDGHFCEQGRCTVLEETPVCACQDPEAPGCGAVAGTVPVQPRDVPREATLESGASVMRFSFTTLPGHAYRFTCGRGTLPSCTIRLLDAGGSVLDTRTSDFTWRQVSLKPWSLQGGTFIAEVSAPGAETGGTFTYQLVPLGADEAGDSPWSALPQTPQAAPIHGRVSVPGDEDVFAFPAVPGHAFTFRCGSEGGLYSGELTLGFYNARGERVATRGNGTDPVLTGLATAHETWFASVAANDPLATGTYRCVLEYLEVDDHADLHELATAVPASGSVTGTIERRDDADVFSAQLIAGHYYRADCTPGTLTVCGIMLRTPGANPAPGFRLPPLVFKAEVSGRYHFSVLGETTLGTYSFQLTDLGLDDHGNTASTATPLAFGEVRGAREVSIDTDVFAFTAEAGHVYRFSCDTTPASQGWLLAFEDAAGTLLDSNRDAPSPSSATMEARTAGRHTVHLGNHSAGSSSPATGTYACLLEELGPDDHGDTAATATPLAPGTELSGERETRQDVDVFSFTATPGHIYRVTCDAETARTECNLRLRDASGNPVFGHNTYSLQGHQLVHENTRTGTLFIELYAPFYPHTQGRYRLHFEDLGPDDHGNTAAAATPITPGTWTGFHHTPQDVDYFSLSAPHDRFYRLTCTGCSLSAEVPPGAGVAINGSTRTVVNMWETATVSFRVHGSGQYSLTLEEAGLDDHGDTPGRSSVLVPGVERTGSLEAAGDRDVFSVRLEAGRTYRRTLSAAPSISAWVSSPTGVSIPLASDGSFTATEAGTWHVTVGSEVLGGPAPVEYRLLMTEP